jgi:hypothetical protein
VNGEGTADIFVVDVVRAGGVERVEWVRVVWSLVVGRWLWW